MYFCLYCIIILTVMCRLHILPYKYIILHAHITEQQICTYVQVYELRCVHKGVDQSHF
uniref:Uncharacterized protein n=1 Tax=Anguilla anguilla TaxID=7936 RepID=A0A0E9QMX0_ANGAN